MILRIVFILFISLTSIGLMSSCSPGQQQPTEAKPSPTVNPNLRNKPPQAPISHEELVNTYYGQTDLKNISGDHIKEELHHIISSPYHSLSYKAAKIILFGSLDLEQDTNGYFLITRYCQDKLTNKNFPGAKKLAPGKIPNQKIINTEHSWPQSKFSKKFSSRTQKSDLHALFPVYMKVNSSRSNHPFGNVDVTTSSLCRQSKLGKNTQGQTVFEPSDLQKGDTARAIFYFSVRYDIKIDDIQEHYLRLWHYRDPVTEDEFNRNNSIYSQQLNRNPFVDYPDLVDQVDDF